MANKVIDKINLTMQQFIDEYTENKRNSVAAIYGKFVTKFGRIPELITAQAKQHLQKSSQLN